MKSLIFMALGVLASGVYYNVPRKSLAAVTVTGAIGYTVYYIINTYLGLSYLGYLLAIMALGVAAGFFARKLKLPTTVFFYPGIIPLVPGRALYLTMYNIVMEEYSSALEYGVQALTVAGILAIGIYLTSYIFDTIMYRLDGVMRRRHKIDGEN